MKKQRMDNENEKHSKFSPSKRERWANCPGSIGMESKYPNEVSEHAEAGIEAHALLESLLRNNGVVEERFSKVDGVLNSDAHYHVFSAYRHVKQLINDLLMQGMRVQIKLEQRVSLTDEVYGTADIIVIAERYGYKQWLLERLYVIDYKHGRVKVEAKDNKQLEFYAVAAYVEMEEDIQFSRSCELHFWILQPKVSGLPITHTIAKDVNDWLVDTHFVIMEEVNKANQPVAQTVAGSWCVYCKASGVCWAYADHMGQNINDVLGRV